MFVIKYAEHFLKQYPESTADICGSGFSTELFPDIEQPSNKRVPDTYHVDQQHMRIERNMYRQLLLGLVYAYMLYRVLLHDVILV